MNHKRKKPRTISRGSKHYPMGSRKGEAPSYWNIIFHSRPKRRKNKANCHKVTVGSADPDELIWELGNRKPHNYYF